MHQINNVENIVAFIRAGNATFTIKSDRTGKHYTYRARVKPPNDVIFISVLGDELYQFIGTIFNGYKFKAKVGGDSSLGFDYFWRWLIERNELPQGITFYHMGRCARCGRELTDPESIERGLGPHCAEM